MSLIKNRFLPILLTLFMSFQSLGLSDALLKAISKKYKVGLYPIDRSEWIDVGNLDHISRLNEIE